MELIREIGYASGIIDCMEKFSIGFIKHEIIIIYFL